MARLAPSARHDFRELLNGWKKGGGNAKALSQRIRKSSDTLQAQPGIGMPHPDITSLPLLFFPTEDQVWIVYQAEPFLILFYIPPWSELTAAFRRRVAQSGRP